jgi:hypothetical protein
LTAGCVLLLGANFQSQKAQEPALTALDYAEIQQLNAHYANALDSCAGNGNEFARLFTPDGSFVTYNVNAEGREALAKFAGSPQYCAPPNNALTINHITVNAMIEPSPEGAIGKSYLLFVKLGKDGNNGQIIGGGKYYDVYAKTPEGWRFKSRRWVRGQDVDLIPQSELSHHPLPH